MVRVVVLLLALLTTTAAVSTFFAASTVLTRVATLRLTASFAVFSAALEAATLLTIELLALLSTVRLLHLLVLDLIEARVVPLVFGVSLANVVL